MGLPTLSAWRSPGRRRKPRRASLFFGSACLVALLLGGTALSQSLPLVAPAAATKPGNSGPQKTAYKLHAQRFLAGRSAGGGAAGIESARRQQAALLAEPRAAISLGTAWQPVGPTQVASLAYGKVTGRVSAIAIDPADATGNTVYVGTTGGGVWRSTNAAGAVADVTFAPLTDTLPVFALDSGHSAIASLSIGALSVANGVVLAGTGDTNDALDSYYGSGLLRSADGGATWTLAQQSNDGANGVHSFVGLGFAGLAWSTVSPPVAVAAVADAAEGELVNAVDSTYSSRGLYFSTDAGVSWQMATIKDGSQTVQQPLANGQNLGGNAVTAVVWNPVRQKFYAAVRYHGYYESVDGAVWTRLAAQPGAGLTTGFCPVNPGTTGSVNCPIFRGAMAVEPASGDTYAFTVDANNGDQGIWRDACVSNGGSCSSNEIAFATHLNAAPLEDGAGVVAQGDYNLALSAMASGSNTLLFAGATDLYRCTVTTPATGAGGCEFRDTTNVGNGCAAPAMVAPGQHALAPLTGSPLPLIFIGNDGGIWRSLDGVAETGSPCSADDASHFDNLNGGLGSLAEVVHFSQHPSDANTLLVGLGANGTAATSTAQDLPAWTQLSDGEGGFSAIDQDAPTNWYTSTAAGVSITYCGKGSACAVSDFNSMPTIGAPQVRQDVSLIDPPWLLDPALSSNVVIGTCRVWRGPAALGAAWPSTNVLSGEFAGSQNTACDGSNGFVRSLAAGGPAASANTPAGSGSTVLYAGMAGASDGGGSSGGHLYATSAANTAGSTTAWMDLSGSPVTNDAANGGVFNDGGFDVSSVAIDPHDATGTTIYATIMGFSGNGVTSAHAYRSTDGGAHWSNISSNLPDAPSNSIAVDPNDAETVYIAMDTGVYVTDQVTKCTSENCWSIYGTALPNAPVTQLVASATIPAGGGMNGELRAATYGRGIWEIPLLSAAPVTSAAITLAPSALTFAAQPVGMTSAAQTITVTNSGNESLLVTAVSASGDFVETDSCTGSPVGVGGSCTVQVAFAPSAVGAESGVLTISANVTGGQATAALSGTAAMPGAVVLSPAGVSFGTVTVGESSATQTVTVQNTGGVAVALQSEAVSGDFRIVSNGCGATLAAGDGCVMGVVFAPTVAGTRNGALSVADSSGTQLASLTGVGASKATDALSPSSLTFGSQTVGTPSDYQTIFLTNTGDTTLNSISAQIGFGDFVAANHCGSTLSGHAACDLLVAFEPTAAGTRTGSLVISDQYGSQTVALTGTAVAVPAVALNPDMLSFPLTVVGQRSTAQVVLVTNGGAGNLTLGSISITGDFTETDDCANRTVTSSYSCSLQVTFAPTASGTRTGLITVKGTLPGQQATATLTGAAVAPAAISLTPASMDFGSLEVGSVSTPESVAISNTGGQPATMEIPTVSGDYRLTANTCGTLLAPGVGCTVSVVFAPSQTGTRSGMLSVADSAGTQLASLTGVGTSSATDGLSPASLSFASEPAGSTSAAKTVILGNAGDNPLTLIASHIASGPFTVTDGCTPVLAAHSTCALQVTFAPVASGAATGALVVVDALRVQTIALSGTASGPSSIGVTPTLISFPATTEGQTSTAQSVIVSSPGGGQVTIAAVAVSGAFAETDNCKGRTLSTGTCSVQVTFAPPSTGALAGTLTVTGTLPNQAAAVALNGSGVAPAAITLTPGSLGFGAVDVGSTTVAQNLTISNTGGVAATLQTITITGDYSVAAETCGLTLAPQTGCTVSIVFTPKTAGPRTGTISVTDSVGLQTASLSGAGAVLATDSLSPLSLTFGPQEAGSASATQAVTLTNSGDDTLTLIATQVSNANYTATNGCGPMLAGHSSCAIQVAFTPTRAGTLTATLTVFDQFRTQTVALSGLGHAPPTVFLEPGSLSFAATAVGGSSAGQTVMITNSGDGQLTVGKIVTTGDFVETDGCLGKVLSGDASCSAAVVFRPTVAGARTGALTVGGTGAGQTASISLNGTGSAPAAIVLDPVSLSFGLTTLGASSAALNLTISNTGGVAATIQGVSINGDFSLTANTCGTTLGPSTGCTVSVVFSPTAAGTRTGVLMVRDSVGTQTANLTGIGQGAATDALVPLSLTFAPQQIDTRSAPLTVTLNNTGDNSLTLISAQIESGDFAVTSACGSSLIGHASCALSVVSVPTDIGPYVGILTVSDQFRTQTVLLSGTGLPPPGISLSPLAGLTFAPTGVTTTSPPQTMTLTNNGAAPLVISSIKATVDFAIPDAANTCPATLAIGAACTFQVVFAPVVGGPQAGTISVATNAPGGQPKLPLAGTGVDFTLYPNGNTSVTIGDGASAEFPLLLSSDADIPGTATLACTGAPASSTCVVTPSSAPLGTETTISLTVLTGTTVGALEPGSFTKSRIWWALVLPLLLPFAGRRYWRGASLLCLAGLLMAVGCGSGRTIPPSSGGGSSSGGGGGGGGGPVTPSGTYSIVASAQSAGLTRSVTLTLVVK